MGSVFTAFILTFLGVAGFVVWFALRRLNAFRAALAHTASALGLRYDPGALWRSPSAVGAVDGQQVDLRFVQKRDRAHRRRDDARTVFTVLTVRGAWDPALSALPRREAKRRGFFAALTDGLTGRQDLVTGDAALDATVALRAPSPFALRARLDAPTRARLAALVGDGDGRVEANTFTLARRGLVTDGPALLALTRAALDLGHGLSRRGQDAEEALRAIAADDPLPRLRAHAFEALATERPRHRATAHALAAALHDPDPAVRVLGAEHAGDGAFEVARDLAVDTSAPAAVRVRALGLLGARYPKHRPEVAATLDAALPSATTAPLGAVCAAAVALGHPLPFPTLSAARDRVDAAIAPAYAGALALHGAAAEAPLVALLALDDSDARAATAQALGEVAGLAAVEPLLAHAGGVFKSRALKAAAREAIAAIQARAGGGTAGALSLAEGEGGELALVDGEEA